MKPTASLFNPDPLNGYLVVFIDGKQYTISSTDKQFDSAVNAFKGEDWTGLHDILNPSAKIKNLYAKYEQIEVKDGNVFVYDEPVNSIIASRILQFLENGIDCVPVFKFLTKLQNNPSKRAVDELYTFLEHRNLPITENGNFLAYKAVQNNYTDVHTGKFLNSVGSVLNMPRNKVDDNKENGCSYGFHAGTLEYASGFRPHNGKMMIVEIDPSDVVSIPIDSECQKLRTARYKVVGEYEDTLTKPLYESKFTTEHDSYISSEWDYEDEEEDVCDDCGKHPDDCYCEDYPEEPVQSDLFNQKSETPWAPAEAVFITDVISLCYANRKPATAFTLRKNFGSSNKVRWSTISDYVGTDHAVELFNLWVAKYE